MRTRLVTSIVLFVVVSITSHAQQPPPAEPTTLPVRRVVLYKNGVGYFEHQGAVTGSVDVAIQFTSGQLNDVLKSLTALDLADGQIASIGFNSVAPIEQRLQALRLPLGTRPDLLQFYNSIRGARVDVRSAGSTVNGRLLGVERKTSKDGVEQVDVLTIVSNDGSVRSIVLTPGVSVRIVEQNLRDELSRYLAVIASGRDADVRRMVLSAEGSGTRQLLVSYISEVPIWKSTYRLVLGDDGEAAGALLQGWAIVDNTVGEDWTNVELSLVAGAPQSFIQQLSQPHYSRRPVVPLPRALLTTPQTHTPTLRAVTPVDQAFERGVAGGVVGGLVGGLPEPPLPPAQPVRVGGRLAETMVAATAQELGDLFEYRLTQPVTILTNQSALVPILNGRVSADRVALWSRAPGNGRPLRAVWITNGTGATLDGGTLSVIDAGAFAGEGLIDALKPEEKRLVSYGTDLAMVVDARLDESSGRYARVIARDGIITVEREEQNRWIYRARNEDQTGRTLVVEHPVRQGWTLTADVPPTETTTSSARFRLRVAARGEAMLALTERHTIENRVTLDELSDRQLVNVSQNGIPLDALRRVLQPAMDARAAVAASEGELGTLTREVASIGTDQQRVRENMQALGTSREERTLRARYTRELAAQEDRLGELETRIAAVTAQRDVRRAAFAEIVGKLSFEVTAP